MLVMSPNIPGALFLLSSITLLERICVRDLVVTTDISVLVSMSQYLTSWLRQLLSLNKSKKISSSLQSPCIDVEVWESHVIELLVGLITCWRMLVQQDHQTRFTGGSALTGFCNF